MIIGENGSGKSTFYEAITFALYGKPFRNINKPNLVNSKNKKGAIVELDFETGGKSYTIRRGLKPVVFDIIVDGKPIDQASTIRDQQDHLEKNIIKMSYKSFTQVVVLGAGNYTSFMNLSAANRREIIEDLLDINIFTKMNLILKAKIDDIKMDLREIESQRKIELAKDEILCDQLEKFTLGAGRENDMIISEIEQAEIQLENIKKSIENDKIMRDMVGSDIENIGNPDEILKKLAESRATVVSRISSLKKTIGFFETNDSCSLCGQGIEHAHKNDVLVKKTKRHDDLVSVLATVDSRIDENMKVSGEKNALAVKWMEYQRKIDKGLVLLEGYARTIKSLSDKKNALQSGGNSDIKKIKSDLKSIRNEISSLDKKKSALEKMLGTYNMALLLLKDGGIKSAIIKQYVPVMNSTINRYLGMMDFPVDFNIDETFSEVIRSAYRDEFTYNSFSEGEKARIDLALLFAWRAVARMKNSINCNILILDEVFDGSLDGTGMEELFKILNSLTGTKTFVISHKTEVLTDKFNNVIRFSKDGGFSKISEER